MLGIVAVVTLVLWSGRGILEAPKPSTDRNIEWLTIVGDSYEFRGVVYNSSEALLAELRRLRPKPSLVNVRWLTQGNASTPSEEVRRNVAKAQSVLREARIASPDAVVGNEVFGVSPSANRSEP